MSRAAGHDSSYLGRRHIRSGSTATANPSRPCCSPSSSSSPPRRVFASGRWTQASSSTPAQRRFKVELKGEPPPFKDQIGQRYYSLGNKDKRVYGPLISKTAVLPLLSESMILWTARPQP
ncbi:hypothetical protein VPH35_102412 [Triticum aestivum]